MKKRKTAAQPYIILLAISFFFVSTLFAQTFVWELQPSGTLKDLHGIEFISASSGWAVGDSGMILKSTSSGLTWVLQSGGTSQPLRSVDFINDSIGCVVGGCNGCGDGVVLKTTDGGHDWVVKDNGRALNSVRFVSLSTGWAVGTDANANGLILKTSDGGEIWTEQVPGVFSFLESVFFINDSSGWIAGEFPGVLLKTTNGGSSWVSETTGVDGGEDLIGVFFIDAQTGWLAGHGFPNNVSTGVIKKTTDGGISWVNQSSGTDQYLLSLAFINQDTGWVSGTGGTLLKTTNGGATWSAESSGRVSELDEIAVRPGAGGWIAGESGTILRNNFGTLPIRKTLALSNSWNMISLPATVSDNRKTSLFPTSVSSAFLYNPSIGYQIVDSIENGKGYWIKFNGSQQVDVIGRPIDSLTINLVNGWNLIGGISADVPVSNIIQNPSGSVVSSFYSYKSTYRTDTLLQAGKAYWVKVLQNCTLTIKSTLEGNIFRNALINISTLKNDEMPPPPPDENSIEEEPKAKSLPWVYSLSQNYPNPFNPITIIKYDLPEPSTVRLNVFNVLGQQVATLVNGQVGAGYQSVEWNTDNNNGTSLPSGIYIYRLQATSLTSGKEFLKVNKMVLIK